MAVSGPEPVGFAEQEMARLREVEEQFILFTDCVQDYAFITLDTANKVVGWNKGAERLFGFIESEMLGQSGALIYTPEDRAAGVVEDELRTALLRGRAEDERWHVRKNCTRFWGSGVLVPLRDPQLKGYAMVLRDLTFRRRAEEELRASEQRLQLAQSVAGIGTWEWEMETNRCTWSESMGPLFGLSSRASLCSFEAFLERVRAEDRSAVESRLRQMQNDDAACEVTFRTKWPDGSEHWIMGKGRMLRDEHGEPSKVVGAAMDITGRMGIERIREAELDHTQKELAALTVRFLNVQDDERRHIARELHDDLAQRLARLGIELEMLRKEPPADQAEVAARLQCLTLEVTAASNDVRRVSHRLHPSILDDLGLEVALRTLVLEFEESYDLSISLVVDDLPPAIPPSIATTLYRIAQEGLRNISKHMREALVMIRISKSPESLQLSLRDTGPGFDVTAARQKGALGLISMQERANLVGGTLVISSTPGEGTEIIATMPCGPSE